MRIAPPLIVGAGPAGCAAAIALARGGAAPVLLDRDEEAGDPLCGGFLSWRTTAQLRDLGVDPVELGGQRIAKLAIFARDREAVLPLPEPAHGLSRHALDNALRRAALVAGAKFEVDTIRQIEGSTAIGQRRSWNGSGLFLASGKHDIRGAGRPRGSSDPALGLRVRLPASPARAALVGDRIELHLFDGGYAGIVLQEDGSANLCLAVRKSVLADAGGDPQLLLARLAQASKPLAARLGGDWREGRIDTIGAVPYGFIARPGRGDLFRLGDQAAVIPSLAGEGMGIALASGTDAARHWLAHGPDSAAEYQRRFGRRARRPVRAAGLAWRLAESGWGQSLALLAARHVPGFYVRLMQATRLPAPALPCAHAFPC